MPSPISETFPYNKNQYQSFIPLLYSRNLDSQSILYDTIIYKLWRQNGTETMGREELNNATANQAA